MEKHSIYIPSDIYPVKNFMFLGYKNEDKEKIYNTLSKLIKTNTALLEIIRKIDEVNLDVDQGQVMSIGSVNVLTMREYIKDDINSLCVLVHELNHMSCNIGRYIGINHSEDSEEFFTYMQDYLLGKVLKTIKDGKSNIK